MTIFSVSFDVWHLLRWQMLWLNLTKTLILALPWTIYNPRSYSLSPDISQEPLLAEKMLDYSKFNLLETSPEYTRAGIFGKSKMKLSSIGQKKETQSF